MWYGIPPLLCLSPKRQLLQFKDSAPDCPQRSGQLRVCSPVSSCLSLPQQCLAASFGKGRFTSFLMRDFFGNTILNFCCGYIGRVVELQWNQKAGEWHCCSSEGWLPGVVRAGHRLVKQFRLGGPLEGCRSYHTLGSQSGSELDPSSKLDHVAQGLDFSKEKQVTGSTGPTKVSYRFLFPSWLTLLREEDASSG